VENHPRSSYPLHGNSAQRAAHRVTKRRHDYCESE
jgi:hypothetical protein